MFNDLLNWDLEKVKRFIEFLSLKKGNIVFSSEINNELQHANAVIDPSSIKMDSDLNNIFDEIIADLNRAKYLLELN